MDNMKEKIADVLREMLNETKLENITVKALCERAQISRQTFYYHFHDIYDVVEWIFLSEAETILAAFDTFDDWQYVYMLIMKWLENHKTLVLNCYRSVQREYIETFIDRILYRYIFHMVNAEAKDARISESQKAFIARFFTLALTGISLDWIGRGMKDDPNELVGQVYILLEGDFHKAIHNFERQNR